MKYTLIICLLLAGIGAQAQLYGHWVNRLPLQCANGDTAQYWKWDCDTVFTMAAMRIDTSFTWNSNLVVSKKPPVKHHKKVISVTLYSSIGVKLDSTNYITGYHWHNDSADRKRDKKLAVR